MPRCVALNATGAPCAAPEHLVNLDGLCRAHREGGHERLVSMASAGGKAFHAKAAAGAGFPGFTAEELPRIVSVEDAKRALDDIRVATLTRRITATEGTSAARTVAEWVKANSAAQTQELVNQLSDELEEKTNEIEALRQQLSKHGRAALQVSARASK